MIQRGLTTIATAAVAAGLLAACVATPPTQPITTITIGTSSGRAGGVFPLLGARLADIYSRRVPGVHVVAPPWGSSDINPDAVEDGRADLAFIGATTAFAAYARGTRADGRPHTRLRGMAVLFASAIHIVVPRDSNIRGVSDLRRRRVAVFGLTGSTAEAPIETILKAHGLSYRDLRVSFHTSSEEIAAMMRDRVLEAGFFYAAVPLLPLVAITQTSQVRLIPLGRDRIDRVQARLQSLKALTIPRGTYSGQTEDITTIGVDNLLICRDDLPEQLVYDLTKELFDAVPELARAHVAATTIDPGRGPTTPIPLHPGAARYYRERELAQ